MGKELFLNAGCVVGDTIYFTTLNDNLLYKYSLSEKKVCIEQKCPWKAVRKFISMQFYRNQIWMIPIEEREIWIYDIERKSMDYMELPRQCMVSEGKNLYARVIQEKEYLWVIPLNAEYILQINMEKREYRVLDEWPEGAKKNRAGLIFETGCYQDNKLYLLSRAFNMNIMVDIATGQMRTWEACVQGKCMEIYENKLITFPKSQEESICIYSLDTDSPVLMLEIVFPSDKWKEHKAYLYWKITEIGEKVFFLPHEADYLMIMNKNMYDIKYIFLDNPEHTSSAVKQTFSVQEVYPVGDKFVVLSNYGDNQFVILNHDCEIEEIITLRTDKVEYGDELSSYIEHKVLKPALRWNNEKDTAERIDLCEETVGKKIYSYLQ